jgi:hypothetical protein
MEIKYSLSSETFYHTHCIRSSINGVIRPECINNLLCIHSEDAGRLVAENG